MSDIDLASFASPKGMARARKIKLFLMDVDGILSDGGDCLISTIAAIGSQGNLITATDRVRQSSWTLYQS
jgi:3-deoxy-D-manno-octulosonate 8-phosphate phosphatase (KDO 8-P phosphatase)